MEIVHNYIGFWKENNYPYLKVLDLSEQDLNEFATALTRRDIIEWLSWNDPNGIYNDEDSEREFGNVMTMEEGIEIMLRQVSENQVTS